jgi:hypothetical protein
MDLPRKERIEMVYKELGELNLHRMMLRKIHCLGNRYEIFASGLFS